MASRARARTTPKPKPSDRMAAIRLAFDDQTVTVDAASSTLRERWEAKESLRAAGLPIDDDELMLGATIWAIAKRTIEGLTLDDVLDSVTLGALMDGTADEDSPEASGAD